MDYSKLQKAEAIPEAASMIETFRAIGYSLETAVADIIDNSISANAKSIYINRLWRGGKSVITIKDDGDGMSSNEIATWIVNFPSISVTVPVVVPFTTTDAPGIVMSKSS